MAESIENHGVIGDLRTAALVALDGTIDFMCWPSFDSPSVFASLLDDERGGHFQLAPVLDGARRRQLYLPDTCILLTRFLSADGVAEVSDFMALDLPGGGQRLLRRAKAVRGTVRFRMECAPRFDYARALPSISLDGDTAVFDAAGVRLRLRATTPLTIVEGAAVAEFELAAGQSVAFVLEDAAESGGSPSTDPGYIAAAFKATSDAWRGWAGLSTYVGRWRDSVTRSALTLKLLTSAAHGSIVAAPTFGLPEHIGGGRNWDYRYTWMRDAAFTLYAFIRVGHTAEASAFMRWLAARASDHANDWAAEGGGDGGLQLMYAVDGRRELTEIELPHLRGYKGSVPVRIGNAAHLQLQLDIHGELMDAIYLSDKYGEQVSWQSWQGITRALTWLEGNWQRPDEGIWEVRGGQRHFLHSRLMCWVAFDRAVRLAGKRSLPGPIERWREVRDAIHREIHEKFWNEERGAFMQSLGSSELDAACLLMPLVRFISPTDPRWLSTLAAVGCELVDDSLVFRYSSEAGDGLHGREGTFTMCSFWYVECLARAGDLAQARFLFEKVLGYANPLGLFSEELGPSGEHLGNFPQAFTHMALISAAHYLDRALSGRGGDR